MPSVNKCILIGHLGKDPDVRQMPNGDTVTSITMATTEKWKDKTTGEKRSETEWHRVVFFRKLAEIAGQYLKKGAMVYIEGSLKTRKWEKDGQSHYTTEIVATEMHMLGGDSAPQSMRPSSAPIHKPAGAGKDEFDDDIPF